MNLGILVNEITPVDSTSALACTIVARSGIIDWSICFTERHGVS
jgi:hypothetical protein